MRPLTVLASQIAKLVKVEGHVTTDVFRISSRTIPLCTTRLCGTLPCALLILSLYFQLSESFDEAQPAATVLHLDERSSDCWPWHRFT